MAESLLYPHGTNYSLQHQPAPSQTPDYDEWGEPLPVTPGASVAFEVQLELSGAGRDQARVGFDATVVDLKGVVVKTPYDTLTLPEGVGAGSIFPVVFRGKTGVLTIGAAPDSSHPLEVDLVGESFLARWRSS